MAWLGSFSCGWAHLLIDDIIHQKVTQKKLRKILTALVSFEVSSSERREYLLQYIRGGYFLTLDRILTLTRRQTQQHEGRRKETSSLEDSLLGFIGFWIAFYSTSTFFCRSNQTQRIQRNLVHIILIVL